MNNWKNTHTRLWAWYPDAPKPEYLGAQGLESVLLSSKGCDIVLTGMMPKAWKLTNIPDGSWLEVHHSECGDPTKYDEKNMIMRFKEIKMTKAEFPSVIALDMKKEGIIEVYVSFRCKLEMWT